MQSGINLAWNRTRIYSNGIYSITIGMLHVIVTGVGAAMPSYSRTLLTSKWYIYIYLSGPFFLFSCIFGARHLVCRYMPHPLFN